MYLALRTAVFGVAVALLTVTGAAYADAPAPRPFHGKIVFAEKKFPTQAKSKVDYVRKVRKVSKDTFWEDKDNKRWKVRFGAFFARPLNDLEVTIKIFDVSGGTRQMVTSFEQYLDGRGQTSIISFLKLDREKFGVNRHLLMTVENRGKVLASGKFKILGEAERYSGKVDFTEESPSTSDDD